MSSLLRTHIFDYLENAKFVVSEARSCGEIDRGRPGSWLFRACVPEDAMESLPQNKKKIKTNSKSLKVFFHSEILLFHYCAGLGGFPDRTSRTKN